jgi:hypothetical protein
MTVWKFSPVAILPQTSQALLSATCSQGVDGPLSQREHILCCCTLLGPMTSETHDRETKP